jgi:hypothetical protein
MTRAVLVAALCGLAPAVAACGGDETTRSESRPPVPLNVSVQIGAERVSASPARLGAGPITLLVNNQDRVQHSLTIDGPRVRQTVGPVSPKDTATLKVTVQPGTYELSAGDGAALEPARLLVGPERQSSQNELLLP